MSQQSINIRPAVGEEDLETTRQLFQSYASSLGFSLCFQGFDQELDGLPGEYAPPSGRLLLAEVDGVVAGCIALKKLDAKVCEMKRLYVRPEFRGLKLGRLLAVRLLDEARLIGYQKMYLDTVPSRMPNAVALYRSLGFDERTAYYHNPLPDVLYMELHLSWRK